MSWAERAADALVGAKDEVAEDRRLRLEYETVLAAIATKAHDGLRNSYPIAPELALIEIKALVAKAGIEFP